MRLTRAVRLLAALAILALAGCSTRVEVPNTDGAWVAECRNVARADCEGIAALFVNNLARNHQWIHDESGGLVRVSPASICPEPPDWAVAGGCWRAEAPAVTTRACMLIARLQDGELATHPFGQIGGDEFTGLAGAAAPGTNPC